MSRSRSTPDWNHLRWIIEFSLDRLPAFRANARVKGTLRYHGEGLGHDNYVFEAGDEFFVLRMGKRYRPLKSEAEVREFLIREAETLRQVAESDFPFATPDFVCLAQDERGTILGLIESHIEGTPLSFFEKPEMQESRFGIIAQVAAAVHELPAKDFDHLPAAGERRDHVMQELETLPETLFTDFPLEGVRAWILAHLPEGPSTILHGDLLPQNLLWDFMESHDVAVIDWERARIGDPAYDLAIVTRGARKPLKQVGGFQQLLDAYNKAAVSPIAATSVRIHELLLHLHWLAEANANVKAGSRDGHGPEFYLDQLASLFGRVRNAVD